MFDWDAIAEITAEFQDINRKFGDYLREELNNLVKNQAGGGGTG
jgi:hypothetical protein